MPVSAFERTRNRTTPSPTRSMRRRGAAVAALAAVAGLLVTGCSQPDDSGSIVRTTTNIAGAGVVGIERDTSKACALPSAPDQTSGTRTVDHVAGTSDVPADPRRIVVLSTAALDAVCALGLWERVVGAATVDGPTPQPSYLGYGISAVPGVGAVGAPDPARVAALRPDLILGDVPTGAASFEALKAIAPTVFVGRTGNWQDEFTSAAAALGRRTAGAAALDSYRAEAADIGTSINANQTQASLVRFTPDAIQVLGSDSFAGQVLADTGAQRPTAQRANSFDVRTDDFTKLEGDLICVMFAGPGGKQYGEKVMRGDAWKELGAATDRRTFVVDDSVWHASGLTAARAVLLDIRNTLNAFVTD